MNTNEIAALRDQVAAGIKDIVSTFERETGTRIELIVLSRDQGDAGSVKDVLLSVRLL